MQRFALKTAVLFGLLAGCFGEVPASEPSAVGPASFAELSAGADHIPLRHVPGLFKQRWSAHSHKDEEAPHWQHSAAVVLNLLEQMNHQPGNVLHNNATELLTKLIEMLEDDLTDYSERNHEDQRELEKKMEAGETAANAAAGAKAKMELDNVALADCYGDQEMLLQKLMKCRSQHGEPQTESISAKSPELCGKDTEIFDFPIASQMVWKCAFAQGASPKECRQSLTADLNSQATKLYAAYAAWEQKQKSCLMNNTAGDPCESQKSKYESASCDGERTTVQNDLASYRNKVQTNCNSLSEFQTTAADTHETETRRGGHQKELLMVICMLKEFKGAGKFTQESFAKCEAAEGATLTAIDYFPSREKVLNSSTSCGPLQFTLHDGIVHDLQGNKSSNASTVNHVIFNANVKASDTAASLYALVVKPSDSLTCGPPLESTCNSMESCMDACDPSADCFHFGVKSTGGADSWWRKGTKCELTSSFTHVAGFNIWQKIVSHGTYETTSQTIFPAPFSMSPSEAAITHPLESASLASQCSLLKLAQYRPAGSQSSKCLCPTSEQASLPPNSNCKVEHHPNHEHIGRLLAEKHMYVVPGHKPSREEIANVLFEHCAQHIPCMQRVLCSEVTFDDGSDGRMKINGTLHIECGDDVQAAHDEILA